MIKKAKAPNLPAREPDTPPILRGLVLVHVDAHNGTRFDVRLTRVPGIGEEICRTDKLYRVMRVQHMAVNVDAQADFGWHALVDAELLPDE